MNEVAEQVQTVADVVSDVQTEPAPLDNARPEWLAEKFNTPEDLASAYSNLESKLGQSEDTVRTTVMSELEQEFNEGRPASAGEYELPESIGPMLLISIQSTKALINLVYKIVITFFWIPVTWVFHHCK